LEQFGRYSKYYDIIYKDKDYDVECKFIENALHELSGLKEPNSILDVGCGTGGHLIPLVKKGYKLTGLDISANMIEILRTKLKESGVVADVKMEDISNAFLDRTYDACICMFAALGYLTTNAKIHSSLRTIRRGLREGALLIMDFWYGPAVLTMRPSVRIKNVDNDGLNLLRIAIPELDTLHHLCNISYSLLVSRHDMIIDRVTETHVVRFFFPEELRHYLSENGFETLCFCEFPHLDRPASDQTWNVAVIAKATHKVG
jgi:SAM-dependent methyltransferase